jgi:DNA-directed RNA polymerase beta' subunit
MTTLEWASDSESEQEYETENVNSNEPRSLSSQEIQDITDGLMFSTKHTPSQENMIYIHREKTRRKLLTIKIRPSKIPELKTIILRQFYISVVAPGEAVGVNAAQCIGEPATQSTLNSVAPNELIFIQETDGTNRVVEIGQWIDNLLSLYRKNVQYIKENRTEYLELPNPVWIQSPTMDGVVSWEKVTAITKHLPIGDLVRVSSKSGRKVTVTQSKSLLVWSKVSNSLVEKEGASVKVGDCVPIIYSCPDPVHINLTITINDRIIPLDNKFGRVIGLFLAQGWTNDKLVVIYHNSPVIIHILEKWCQAQSISYKNNLDTDLETFEFTMENDSVSELFRQWFPTKRKLPDMLLTTSKDFIRGLLDGYVAGNGRISNKPALILSCKSNDLISGISVLCNRLDIFGKRKTTNYIIKNTFFQEWVEKIGSCLPNFLNTMKSMVNHLVKEKPYIKQSCVILDPITNIKLIHPTKYVYDLTIPTTKNFSIWNGFALRDTFHFSGISAKNITLGFPRTRELFNATKSPSTPTVTIFFNRNNEDPQSLHKVADKIPMSNVNDLLKNWCVFDPDNYELKYWHTAWYMLHSELADLTDNDWCLRLEFQIDKLYERDLTVADIAKKLQESYVDIICIPSPLNLGIIDLIINCETVSISGSHSPELENIKDDFQARLFYMNKIVSPKIRGEIICGVLGITQIYKRKVKSADLFGGFPLKSEIANRLKQEEEWIVDTDGTNLEEILSLPGVDSYRTISNDIWEISNLLGIEASRKYLFIEFMNIISGGGSSINPVHIETLVGKMTYTGQIRAIARFGVETAQYDPIARATFEEVTSQLITSAVFSECDHLSGISSNIVLGTEINAGTGSIFLEDIPTKIVSHHPVVCQDI